MCGKATRSVATFLRRQAFPLMLLKSMLQLAKSHVAASNVVAVAFSVSAAFSVSVSVAAAAAVASVQYDAADIAATNVADAAGQRPAADCATASQSSARADSSISNVRRAPTDWGRY